MAEKAEIQSASDFKNDKKGLAARWGIELEAAKKDQEKWHVQADKIIKRFLGKVDDAYTGQRVNLFSANVQTQRAMMYGKTPKIDCKRRFDDAKDDVARVGAEILERLKAFQDGLFPRKSTVLLFEISLGDRQLQHLRDRDLEADELVAEKGELEFLWRRRIVLDQLRHRRRPAQGLLHGKGDDLGEIFLGGDDDAVGGDKGERFAIVGNQ